MMIVVAIMTIPCIPTSVLYVAGVNTLAPDSRLLEPDHPRGQAADREQHQHGHQVLDPDHLVIGAEAEVAPHALVLAGQLKLLLVRGLGLAQAPPDGTVGGADPDQEEHEPADVGGDDRVVGTARIAAADQRVHDDRRPRRAPTMPSTRPETMLGTSTRLRARRRARVVMGGSCAALIRCLSPGSAGRSRWPPFAATQVAKSEAETTLTCDHMNVWYRPHSSTQRVA